MILKLVSVQSGTKACASVKLLLTIILTCSNVISTKGSVKFNLAPVDISPNHKTMMQLAVSINRTA